MPHPEDSFEEIDISLKSLILQQIPIDDSFGVTIAIKSNNCRNDLVRLIFERAKLRLISASDNYFLRPKIRVPFVLDPFEISRLIRERGNVSEIISVKRDRVTDVDFQVHKHALIQSVIHNICRSDTEILEDLVDVNFAYYDGFEPMEYAMFYATKPALMPLDIDSEDPKVPDCSFSIVNLFDSRYSITTLYRAFNQRVTIGAELFLIVPYDHKMWTVTAANIIEGSYSYQWITQDISPHNTNEFVASRLLPVNFFRESESTAQLRIRPFGSNKVLIISRDEFIAIFAQGAEEQSFPETRQISHGFAEVSLINFYPIHQVNSLAGIREIKGTNIPFNKRLLIPKTPFETSPKALLRSRFALSIKPPWPYLIDDKLYDKTKKAAIQTRITRNLIVPLIYHLFAHSTHIVFNGAIVTLQKVMSPEMICQLTEILLEEIVPIKLKVLQAGHAIKANADLTKSQLAVSAAKAILISVYSDQQVIDGESLVKTIHEIFTNPEFLSSNTMRRETNSFQTYPSGSTSLDPIRE